MHKIYDNPKSLVEPPAHYSNVVKVELGEASLLFLSGMVSFEADGTIVGKNDFAAQAERAFLNIQAALQAHGARMDDVVKTTTYLSQISDMDKTTAMRERFFPKNPPTSTTVQVSSLAHPDLHIEVEVIAVMARYG